MKRTLKMLAILIGVVALSITTSCTKEESNQSGSGNPGGGNSTNSAFPFTLGYYHPEKKVKKITHSHTIDGYYHTLCSYDFTWNGNDLCKVTSKRQDYDEGVVYSEENSYYTFTYNDLGYIHTISYYTERYDTESESYDGTFILRYTDTVHYMKSVDWYDTSYYVWIGLDYNNTSYSNWINRDYNRDLFFVFDSRGLLKGFNGKEVTSDANGNIVLERNYYEHEYDNKKNPFMNLIFKRHDGGYNLSYAWECALFVCPNNCVDEDGGIPLVYQYNGNYPSAISRKNDEYQESRWEIEYY